MSAYGVQPAYALVAGHRILSRRSVAHIIGVAPATLYAALRGEIAPTERMPERLALVLDVPVESLFTPSALAAATGDRRVSA